MPSKLALKQFSINVSTRSEIIRTLARTYTTIISPNSPIVYDIFLISTIYTETETPLRGSNNK